MNNRSLQPLRGTLAAVVLRVSQGITSVRDMRCGSTINLTKIFLLLAATGCSPDIPNASDTISAEARRAPYPELVYLPKLLQDSERESKIEQEVTALGDRVAGLRAKANALRGRSVIDGQTRIKLLETVAARGF